MVFQIEIPSSLKREGHYSPSNMTEGGGKGFMAVVARPLRITFWKSEKRKKRGWCKLSKNLKKESRKAKRIRSVEKKKGKGLST
jgi:hypothetical protein